MSSLYEPGLIICFMGTLGAGKTLHMSVQAYIASCLGVPVYGNYEGLFPGFRRLNGIRDLVTVENGLLALDEMQAILDSRSFAKNVDITQWLLLIRKMGLGCFYTSQHIDFCDIRLRQITDYVFKQEKCYHYGQKATKVDIFKLDGNIARFVTRSVLVHQPSMYKLYNTYDRRVKLTIDGYEVPFKPDWLEVSEVSSSSPTVSSDMSPVVGIGSSAPAVRPRQRRIGGRVSNNGA